ncbi:hypothetical protein AA0482_0701 [Acetobacter cibinongensis NRIC 0482]|nr:hypothetical protein AA0482_0701 [Acetobacter cibinongensis NRIC 0482]
MWGVIQPGQLQGGVTLGIVTTLAAECRRVRTGKIGAYGHAAAGGIHPHKTPRLAKPYGRRKAGRVQQPCQYGLRHRVCTEMAYVPPPCEKLLKLSLKAG